MYQLLLQILQSDNEERGVLLTAHHRDDSTETLLLKLLRGVHITNLAGMDPVSELSDTPRAIWARPLLGITKHDIQEFLVSQQLLMA
jgi:tRNA(Ile)-lysidine synthase